MMMYVQHNITMMYITFQIIKLGNVERVSIIQFAAMSRPVPSVACDLCFFNKENETSPLGDVAAK